MVFNVINDMMDSCVCVFVHLRSDMNDFYRIRGTEKKKIVFFPLSSDFIYQNSEINVRNLRKKAEY